MSKTRAFTLPEILVVLFLMGIVGYIVSVLYIHIFRSYSRFTATDGIVQRLDSLLLRLADDLQNSSPQGLNHFQSGSDWSLYLVLKLPPTSANSASWSNQVVFYQYQHQAHKLVRATLKSPEIDGQPILKGDDPPRLAPAMFENQVPQANITIPSLTSAPWGDPKTTLKLELSSPEIKTVYLNRNFSEFLNS